MTSGARLSAAHAFSLLLCSQGILLCKKLSSRWSGSVIFAILGLMELCHN